MLAVWSNDGSFENLDKLAETADMEADEEDSEDEDE